ncbi:MAG: hypothetical protein ACRCVT_16250, partial [Leadbetterella sp.]
HGKLLWLRDFMINRLLGFFPVGPSDKDLEKGSTICYAEVRNEKGQLATSTILGPEAYVFTAHTLLLIAKNILSGDFKSGYQTPNLYGVKLIKNIPKVQIL